MKLSASRKYRYIWSFISHDSRDNPEARDYYNKLTDAEFSAFEYGRGSPLGKELNTLRYDIENSHFFLLLITNNSTAPSQHARWVRREVGLAKKINEINNGYRPLIIPICGENCWWREHGDTAPEIIPLDFDTGTPLAPFRLQDFRMFDKYSRPKIDTDDLLIEYITPQIHISRKTFSDTETFYKTGVFKLYEDIFPNHEMDDPDDIIAWVLRDDVGRRREVKINEEIQFDYQLDSRLFILTLCDKAIGLGFFTYDYKSQLIFGNYIAVQQDWRSGDIASAFKDEIMKTLNEDLFPDNKGVIFEVEKFDETEVRAIIDELKDSGRKKLTEWELDQIRRFRRVGWYQLHNCRFFIDGDTGLALSCRSPCLDPKLPKDKWLEMEEEYWLMWCPNGGRIDVSRAKEFWAEAVEFVYMEILTKSLVEKHSEVGDQYWDYASKIVIDQLNATVGKNVRLGTLFNRRSHVWKDWVDLNINIAM